MRHHRPIRRSRGRVQDPAEGLQVRRGFRAALRRSDAALFGAIRFNSTISTLLPFYMMLTRSMVWDGRGPFRLYAIAVDREGHAAQIGSTAVSIDNSIAEQPFGTSTVRGQGAVVSGMSSNTARRARSWIQALASSPGSPGRGSSEPTIWCSPRLAGAAWSRSGQFGSSCRPDRPGIPSRSADGLC